MMASLTCIGIFLKLISYEMKASHLDSIQIFYLLILSWNNKGNVSLHCETAIHFDPLKIVEYV